VSASCVFGRCNKLHDRNQPPYCSCCDRAVMTAAASALWLQEKCYQTAPLQPPLCQTNNTNKARTRYDSCVAIMPRAPHGTCCTDQLDTMLCLKPLNVQIFFSKSCLWPHAARCSGDDHLPTVVMLSNAVIQPVHPHWTVVCSSQRRAYIRIPLPRLHYTNEDQTAAISTVRPDIVKTLARISLQQLPGSTINFRMLAASNTRVQASGRAPARAGTFKAVKPARPVQARASGRDQPDVFASTAFAAAAAALLLVSRTL
jgi:hypothetical protein